MLRSLVIIFATLMPFTLTAETYLLMAEEAGCAWCARWNAEIAPIYPKTAEGRAAPLRRFDLNDAPPEAELASRVRFTPTFILVRDGQEIDRIEGYPGEHFFWGLLGMMLERADITLDKSG